MIKGVKITAPGSEPLDYHFAEADGKGVRYGERRRDLPSGKLKPGETFKTDQKFTAKDARKSLCIVARNAEGEVVGSACDAKDVVIGGARNPSTSRSRARPTERKRTKVHGMNDLKKEDLGTIRIIADPSLSAGGENEGESRGGDGGSMLSKIFINLLFIFILGVVIYIIFKFLGGSSNATSES